MMNRARVNKADVFIFVTLAILSYFHSNNIHFLNETNELWQLSKKKNP